MLKGIRPDWWPKGWCIHQMDVHNAFLNGDLLEEVYMTVPAGLARQGEQGKKKFKMKDLGELNFFLGIEVSKSSKGIHLSQRKYALELIAETSLGGAKPAATPLKQNLKLTSAKYDEAVAPKGEHEDPILKDPDRYQRLVGRLLYLTMTRPDLAFSIQKPS
ncbi:uncharacterized mitochondrial protein AtMg00810-like [Solanum dulcamara]|uniref:uncharacterized mitochondrial protein AtMg00810-like n=1 Tax=Solanum dulcamara TaxID=45834 RepID=UPI002484FB7C|nr:uncharacterized mitochondrial protein AtMg00810-like [Solanum dulcamara]